MNTGRDRRARETKTETDRKSDTERDRERERERHTHTLAHTRARTRPICIPGLKQSHAAPPAPPYPTLNRAEYEVELRARPRSVSDKYQEMKSRTQTLRSERETARRDFAQQQLHQAWAQDHPVSVVCISV